MRIVYLSMFSLALLGSVGRAAVMPPTTNAPSVKATSRTEAQTVVAAFTPDPSTPPVVTQGSGTR